MHMHVMFRLVGGGDASPPSPPPPKFATEYLCNNPSATMCLFNNMSVRNKFMHVRSLWKLCARSHVHSLKRALGTTPGTPPNQEHNQGRAGGKCPLKILRYSPNHFGWVIFYKISCILCLSMLLSPPLNNFPPNFFFLLPKFRSDYAPAKMDPPKSIFWWAKPRVPVCFYISTYLTDNYFDGVGHFPESTTQERCKVCQKNTRIMCIKCSKLLHRSSAAMCWEMYHEPV